MNQKLNIGKIDKPCLIFGGAYSNLQAINALFEAAEQKHIPAHRIICTGDVVAYCGDPQASVDIIKAQGIHVIRGNCEESIAANSADCGCGYDSGSACDLLSIRWYQFASARLNNQTKNWMGKLPQTITFQMAGFHLKVVHGAVSSVNRFIFPSTATHIKQAELDLGGMDGIICGHSGVPFSQIIDHRLWHNAGVIGMPANDGTPRVWYSVLTPEANQIRINHYPLSYEHGQAATSMQRNNLPQEYAQTLMTGLWHSDSIMPDEDRRQRGRALTAQCVTWAN